VNEPDLRVEAALAPVIDHGLPAVDALRLTATSTGDTDAILRAAVIVLPDGLRFFLPPHLDHPVALRPGEHATEWVASIIVSEWFEARGFAGRTPVRAEFIIASSRIGGAWDLQVNRTSVTQGRGPSFYSEPFIFDTRRWPA